MINLNGVNIDLTAELEALNLNIENDAVIKFDMMVSDTITGTQGVFIGNDGSNSNSNILSLKANRAGTLLETTLATIYGADPYARLSPPNDAGTATATLDIHDTNIACVVDSAVDWGTATTGRLRDFYLGGDLSVYGANVGINQAASSSYMIGMTNTAGPVLYSTIGASTTIDNRITFDADAAAGDWAFGVDNTGSWLGEDAFVVSAGNTLGSQKGCKRNRCSRDER